MNAVSDLWIPVVGNDGAARTVSLLGAFEHGHEIRDLAVRPHERVALMRLLLAVAHAALDGPADHDAWAGSRERLAEAAGRYLRHWVAAFELFGNGPRFLQVSDLVSAKANDTEGNAVSKLDLGLATGNNPTLFDNSGSGARTFPPARLALMLLTYQCYSPGGTIGVARWNGRPTLGWSSYPKPAPGQSSHAPCLPGSMLHAFPRASSLLATIQLNLLTRDEVTELPGIQGWGQPVWERMPNSAADEPAIANATTTYLGRLVPLSRAIRLHEDGESMLLANGLDYPSWPDAREPSASIITRPNKGKPERFVVSASLDKAPWRELGALTVKSISASSNGGPLVLTHLDGNEPFDLWVGGMVADKAKVLDVVESVFHVPAAMHQAAGRECYEAGVQFATEVAWKLGRAVSAYHAALGDSLDRPEARDRRENLRAKAAFQFWTQAERSVSDLLATVAAEARPADRPSWARSRWGRVILQAGHEAYSFACPRQTARQMEAYVKGLAHFSVAREATQPS